MAKSTAERKDASFALARHAVNTKYGAIPKEAIEATKIDILTTLGCAVGASTTEPVCKKMVDLVKEIGGKKESTIIVYGGKVPCHMATFANAALAHGLNFEDCYDDYSFHIGIAILPPALAVAERVGIVSGKEFIAAFTTGADIAIRLCRAANTDPSLTLLDLGWAPEQIFGYIPAAAVAGRLLGLNEDEMANAFGLAFSQTSGLIETIIGVSVDKAIYTSYSGMSGVLAALMAQKGIIGPRDCIESKRGLFNVFFRGRKFDSASLTRDLGKSFEGAGVGFYPYPCSGGMHAFIHTALQMAKEHKLRPEDVAAVTLFVGPMERDTIRYVEPLSFKQNPPRLSDAQMSLPFSVATALAKGTPRIKHFVEGFNDPEILRISNKVTYQYGPEYGMKVGRPEVRPVIEITLTDGRVLRDDKTVYRYGHPKNPMSMEEHIEKFRDCVSYSAKPISQSNVDKAIEMLTHLEEVDDVSQIVKLVSQPD